MPKHKDQRVGVFVDVQNLYYSAKQFYHTKVNFAHILNRAIAGRQLIRAIAYVIKADIKDEVNFFDALEKIGYDVRSKDLQTFFGGAKKGDWDVGIAMDIMRMASKLDVVVLVSGDGDFNDLLEHVKALGCRAEVIAFRKTVSSRILAVTDEFIDLDRELDKTLIKDENYSRKVVAHEAMNPRPQKPFRGPDKMIRPRPPFRKPMGPIERPMGPPMEHSEANFIQMANLDQPDLHKVNKEAIVMPPSDVAARPVQLPAAIPKPEIQESESRKKLRAQREKKSESMLKKVISKVTKKKQETGKQ